MRRIETLPTCMQGVPCFDALGIDVEPCGNIAIGRAKWWEDDEPEPANDAADWFYYCEDHDIDRETEESRREARFYIPPPATQPNRTELAQTA